MPILANLFGMGVWVGVGGVGENMISAFSLYVEKRSVLGIKEVNTWDARGKGLKQVGWDHGGGHLLCIPLIVGL